MKKTLVLSLVLLLTSCGSGGATNVSTSTTVAPTEIDSHSERYVLFTVNTQEFIYEEQSVETLNRLLDLHEQYELPVDIYLTEDILRAYEENAPDLVERLKTSPLVAVSYHYRPPVPYSTSAYDFLNLDQMDSETLSSTLYHYETHATDPVSGESTEEEGGYEYVKEVFGYAPIVVGMAADRRVGDALGEIYKKMGATFVVAHGDTYDLGEERYGLFLRPEDFEVILSEYMGQDPQSFIPELWGDRETGFMNIKVHDNDFIASQSAWLSIYSKQKPPYDLDRGTTERELLTSAESDAWWSLYETCLKTVSEHPELYQAINAFDLQKLVK